MAVNPNDIQQAIVNVLPGAKVTIKDLVGDGDHLQAIVVTDLFEGKTLLEQHQMVLNPLREVLKADLHALTLKTYSQAQWDEFQKNVL